MSPLTFQRVSIHSARKTDGEKVRLRILSELMFFGFLNGNKQDKLVNERKRYFRGRVRKACMAEVLNRNRGKKLSAKPRVWEKRQR